MLPNKDFLNQPMEFWANVRFVSQEVGYSTRRTKEVKVPTLAEILGSLQKFEFKVIEIQKPNGKLTVMGDRLIQYFEYRAEVLNSFVEPLLMTADEAEKIFQRLYRKLSSGAPIPMNKQKGEKRKPAFLTGIVNMLIDANRDGVSCDFSPRKLTLFSQKNLLRRTLSRRIDGAFPDIVNPVAIWEIKEFYYTTSFGSRVADAVFESQLDGMELLEFQRNTGNDIQHYLIIDAHFAWWNTGRSYLCRIIDMLHMGFVTEVLFGREVVERLPEVVAQWVDAVRSRMGK